MKDYHINIFWSDEILACYPDLEPEDNQQALEYAAWLAQEEVHSS